MTTDKDELLQQARDSLAAAKSLLANGYAGYIERVNQAFEQIAMK